MRLLPSLDSCEHIYRGKVRDVYDVSEEHLLLVVSPRVSAFDRVFPNEIPFKAEVLNLLSAHWFELTSKIVHNHIVATRMDQIFIPIAEERDTLRGRCAIVRRTTPIRYECVVRGYLDGSAWREYQETGKVCEYELPKGLKRYDKLPEPIFTPAAKNDVGHDENVTVEFMAADLGTELTKRLQKISLELYNFAANYSLQRGIQLLDTKFEFGFAGDELLLIDEIFTPDSSRYRAVGFDGEGEPLALDKQFLRDWLAETGYKGEGDPPVLPDAIVNELSKRYQSAYLRLTGETIEEAMEDHG